MLAHPGVAEAVCFAAPDAHYGEVVAAAVVLNDEGRAVGDAIGEDERWRGGGGASSLWGWEGANLVYLLTGRLLPYCCRG